MTAPAGKEREHNFQPGDNVEVCEGELINLQGKILSVDGNKITIMPKHEDLKVGARCSQVQGLVRSGTSDCMWLYDMVVCLVTPGFPEGKLRPF